MIIPKYLAEALAGIATHLQETEIAPGGCFWGDEEGEIESFSDSGPVQAGTGSSQAHLAHWSART